MDKATPSSPQRIRRPDYQWKSDFLSDFFPAQKRGSRCPPANAHVKLNHFQPEFLAVFGSLNSQNIHPDNLHSIMVPHSCLITINTQIQCSLATHGRQHRIDVVFFQDFFDVFLFEGLEINMIGIDLIGHDGGRVGVDEHHLNAFLAQRAGGLGAGIIEFTRLTDDNGAAADNQHGADASVSGHF